LASSAGHAVALTGVSGTAPAASSAKHSSESVGKRGSPKSKVGQGRKASFGARLAEVVARRPAARHDDGGAKEARE